MAKLTLEEKLLQLEETIDSLHKQPYSQQRTEWEKLKRTFKRITQQFDALEADFNGDE